MTKSEKLQIFRLIQDRELGLYHQCPWLFQERVEKSLIKVCVEIFIVFLLILFLLLKLQIFLQYDRYEFIKFQSYSGPIVIDE